MLPPLPFESDIEPHELHIPIHPLEATNTSDPGDFAPETESMLRY